MLLFPLLYILKNKGLFPSGDFIPNIFPQLSSNDNFTKINIRNEKYIYSYFISWMCRTYG